MKKILLILGLVIHVFLSYGQGCPGPSQRTALINLQRSNVIEGSRAGQLPLTDTCGNLRYSQYVEVNLVPISYTPTSTGNTENLSEFVEDPAGNEWYIDWQGQAVRLSAEPDRDWLKISNNQIPYAINDSIYTGKYAAVNLRYVWPNAQFLWGDSTSLTGGNAVGVGLRDVRHGFVRLLDSAAWSSIGQEGRTFTGKLGYNTNSFRIQKSQGTGPTLATITRDIFAVQDDSLILFKDYPNVRADIETPLNFLYTDAQGYLQSGAVGDFPGIAINGTNGLNRTGDDIKLGGTLTDASTTINGGTNRLFFTSIFQDGGVNSGYEFSNTLTTASLTVGLKGSAASSNASSFGVVGLGTSNSGGVYGNAGAGTGVYGGAGTGNGVRGQSTSGIGIYGQSNGGLPGLLSSFPGSTNNISEVLRISRSSSGTAANGIGGSITFQNESSDSQNYESANIASTWTDVTVGTRSGDLKFYTTNNATSALRATIAPTGALRLHNYGSGTFTGTATYTLQTDANGNIIEGPASGGSVPAGTSTQTLRYDATNTLVATSEITNNGSEVGIGGAPVAGFELYTNGATRTDGTGVFRGSGSAFSGGLVGASVRLTNTVASSSAYLGVDDSGVFHLQQNSGNDIITTDPTVGAVAVTNSFDLQGVISPASIGSDQNDYDLGDGGAAARARLTSSTAVSLGGITGGRAGRLLAVNNIGSNSITLSSENTSSTAANRFALGGDLVLNASDGVILMYDAVSSRWRYYGAPAQSSLTYEFSSPVTGSSVTIPSRAKAVQIVCIGAGGGAGSGRRGASGSTRCGGGGGGAGTISETTTLISALGGSTTLSVTNGAGGTGGATVTADDTNGNNGTAGGTTSVSSGSDLLCRAAGGSNGFGGTSSAGNGGSAGQGDIAGSNGAAANTGGGAGISSTTINTRGGSGGGSGGGITSGNGASNGGSGGQAFYGQVFNSNAGTTGSPNATAAATSLQYGCQGGGGGASNISGNGGNGSNGVRGSGGGGGGAAVNAVGNSGAGGNGGDGYVRIIFLF